MSVIFQVGWMRRARADTSPAHWWSISRCCHQRSSLRVRGPVSAGGPWTGGVCDNIGRISIINTNDSFKHVFGWWLKFAFISDRFEANDELFQSMLQFFGGPVFGVSSFLFGSAALGSWFSVPFFPGFPGQWTNELGARGRRRIPRDRLRRTGGSRPPPPCHKVGISRASYQAEVRIGPAHGLDPGS